MHTYESKNERETLFKWYVCVVFVVRDTRITLHLLALSSFNKSFHQLAMVLRSHWRWLTSPAVVISRNKAQSSAKLELLEKKGEERWFM